MANRYWVGGAATWDATAGTKWATTSGGAGGAAVPTSADDVFIDAASTGAVTLSNSSVCRSLNCTGYTGTITHPISTTITIGDGSSGAGSVALVFSSTMTYTPAGQASSVISFATTSIITQTIDWGGKNVASVTFNGVGGKWSYQSDHLSAGAAAVITLTNGSLTTNGYTCNWGSFSSNNTNTRILNITNSTVNLSMTTAAGTLWNLNATNLTFTSTGSTINVTAVTANARTFAGGGATYNTVNMTANNSSGAITITGSNTFSTFAFSDATTTRTLTLTAGTTQTILTAFNVNGTPGKLITINSSSAGTPATLTKSSGTITCSYLSIQDSTATGGASWYAGTTSTNVSGNTGWIFGNSSNRGAWGGNSSIAYFNIANIARL